MTKVKIEKFIFENGLYFTPSWGLGEYIENTHGDSYYPYYYIAYNHIENEFYIEEGGTDSQIPAPFYFKSTADARKVINKCEKELKILFKIK